MMLFALALLLLSDKFLEARSLVRSQHFEEFLTGSLELVAYDRFNELVSAVLAFFEDFINAFALFGGQIQLALGTPEKLETHAQGGLGERSGLRTGIFGLRQAHQFVVHQQATGDHAGPEDDDGGEDDFPGIHQLESGEVSWLTAASTVLSSSWDKSVVEVTAGRKADQPASNSMMPTHGAAARQSARAHRLKVSGRRWTVKSAMIRFSKA